MEQSLVLHLSS